VTQGLGLDAVRADLTPDQKVLLVLTERKNGPVMMVGDGVNDAPALAAADVGVAMGARGAAASAEAADVVLLVDHLDRLLPGIEDRPGRAGGSPSKASSPGSACRLGMIAAAFGYLTPVQGALLQEVIDVAVILNALRALRITRRARNRRRAMRKDKAMTRILHREIHLVHRIGWLRAAVLGANDGLVSTASLVVGVAAAGSGRTEVLIAGLAGLVAGAMSMAAGEYVSVSSQTDAEKADLARETRELAETPEAELDELTQIYVERGLDDRLARQVAIQLTEKDALGAHMRDELGISETITARPIQAAVVSALTFAIGAIVPLIVAGLAPASAISLAVAITTLPALAVLGGLGASAGGAGIAKGALRVSFWGALAMAATAAVGMVFGVSV
jgi:VIT1/CCC1 family predicted Fe2+/Mn2+ transporter